MLLYLLNSKFFSTFAAAKEFNSLISNQIYNLYGRLSPCKCNKYMPKNFWGSTS